MGVTPENLRDVAANLAQAGGQFAAERLGTAKGSLKADASWVTNVDHAVQSLILDRLAAKFPDHAVLAEETMDAPERHAPLERAEYCWVIDPIDGTRNFLRELPVFSTSIGVVKEGSPIAGAIYDPLTDRLYAAHRGGGAFLNERRLAIENAVSPYEPLVGIPSDRRMPIPEAVVAWRETYVLRCLGSSALHMALVAAGCLDAAYAQETRAWDIAAGVLLVTEAGGVVTDLNGDTATLIRPNALHDPTPFLAGTATLHAELLRSFA